MPIQRCTSSGKPGFKFGPSGKCFTYIAGDKSSREKAKRRAESQGRAIQANKRKDNK